MSYQTPTIWQDWSEQTHTNGVQPSIFHATITATTPAPIPTPHQQPQHPTPHNWMTDDGNTFMTPAPVVADPFAAIPLTPFVEGATIGSVHPVVANTNTHPMNAAAEFYSPSIDAPFLNDFTIEPVPTIPPLPQQSFINSPSIYPQNMDQAFNLTPNAHYPTPQQQQQQHQQPQTRQQTMYHLAPANGPRTRLSQSEILAATNVHIPQQQPQYVPTKLTVSSSNYPASSVGGRDSPTPSMMSGNEKSSSQPGTKKPRITDKDRRDTIRDGLEQLRSLVLPNNNPNSKTNKHPSQATIIAASVAVIRSLQQRMSQLESTISDNVETHTSNFQQQQQFYSAQQQQQQFDQAAALKEENERLKQMVQTMIQDMQQQQYQQQQQLQLMAPQSTALTRQPSPAESEGNRPCSSNSSQSSSGCSHLDALLNELSSSGLLELGDSVCCAYTQLLLSDLLSTRLPSSQCMIWRVSSQGRIIEVNDEFCRQTGYHPLSFIDKTPCDLPLRMGLAPIPMEYQRTITQQFRNRSIRQRLKRMREEPSLQGNATIEQIQELADEFEQVHTPDANADETFMSDTNLSEAGGDSNSSESSSEQQAQPTRMGHVLSSVASGGVSFSIGAVPPLPESSLDNFFPHNCPHVSNGGAFDKELNTVAKLHANFMLKILQDQRERRRAQGRASPLGNSCARVTSDGSHAHSNSSLTSHEQDDNNSNNLLAPNLLCLLNRMHTANGDMLESIVGLTLATDSFHPSPTRSQTRQVKLRRLEGDINPPMGGRSTSGDSIPIPPLPTGITPNDTILVFAPISCRRRIPRAYAQTLQPMIYQSSYGHRFDPPTTQPEQRINQEA